MGVETFDTIKKIASSTSTKYVCHSRRYEIGPCEDRLERPELISEPNAIIRDCRGTREALRSSRYGGDDHREFGTITDCVVPEKVCLRHTRCSFE